MMKPVIIKGFVIALLLSFAAPTPAQPGSDALKNNETATPEAKPYKVVTNGRRVTIQSKQNIKSVIVWTASGHRIVEQKALNANTFTFNITVKEKLFYIMLEMQNGKRHTEKIGVQ
jgi:hypothetical protein